MQDFEALYVEFRGQNAHPGSIAARSGEACRQAAAEYVVGHADNWDLVRRTLRRPDAGVAKGDDEIDVLRKEFADKLRRALVPALSPGE
jgi:hypothetical protein